LSLATHLLNAATNERVTVAEVRGTLSKDLLGAFDEMEDIASGTRCKKAFYHAKINPDPSDTMTPEMWARSIEALEKNLGLTPEHSRAVVFHIKEGREHAHIVWGRIDPETMRAWHDGKNYEKHERTSQELAREFGHAQVKGVHTRDQDAPRPERTPDHWEMQQGDRLDKGAFDVRAQVRELRQQADGGKAFAASLNEHGYTLAQGRGNSIALLDEAGGVHSLARVLGVKVAEIKGLLGDLDRASLPTVDKVRELLAARVTTPQLASAEMRDRLTTPQGANMATIDPALTAPTLEAFAKNLERGETGERFDAYLKQSGLSLARDTAAALHVTNGKASVPLERIISDADKREFLPHLVQPVTVAALPELKTSLAAQPAAPEPTKTATPEQERLAARERIAQEIGKAWQSSHGDGLQFAIALGDKGLTLATGDRGKYVAVDTQGAAHYMNARMLGGDTRSGEAAITDSLQKVKVSLPTVPEVRQELNDERRAAWIASQDAQRKAATAARDEERKAQAAEREQQRHAQRVEKLSHNPMVQTIRHAWSEAQTGQQFAAGLEVAGVLLVRVNENDAAESRHRQEVAKSHGYFAPAYKEGDYLALNKWGNAYALDMATLNAKAEDITKKLATLAPAQSLTLTQGKEVMSYWRAPAEFVSKTREAGQAGALGAGLILGGAVRIGEAAVKTLGGVLDYFFGGMSPQKHAPTAPSNNASRTPPPPLPRPTPQEQLRRLPPTISLPQTQEALRQLGGGADADILTEIRRQIEAAKNRDRDRSR
jgi:hypothetical protein